MPDFTEISLCRLCSHPHFIEVLRMGSTPVGDHYLPTESHPEKQPSFPLNVFQCVSCGHVQLRTVVDPAYLYINYIYTTSSSSGLPEHFRTYAEQVVQFLDLKKGDLVIEMGSNDGTLLMAFQQLGMKVLGIDPAREISEEANRRGIPTINAFFSPELADEIANKYGKATLFLANNVMANVSDPRTVLEGVGKLLSQSGVFVFETGYLKYLAEDTVFDNIYHEHIDYYSITPLVRFFQSIEMEVFHVDETLSKGSSIRCFVQRTRGGRAVSLSVGALLEREARIGYGKPEPYIRLSKRLESLKEELHSLIREVRANGGRLAGYGASVGVTTVLYYLDLGQQIDHLIDDNQGRQGRFSPGLGLEVKAPSVLMGEKRPTHVLILAWRYADQIIAKNGDYLKSGGKFIIFLPKIEIVSQ